MKARKLFFIVFIAVNLSLILYGLLALIIPSVLLVPFSLNVYQFPADAIGAITYLEALFRLLGFFNMILGSVGLMLLYCLRTSWQTRIVRTTVASTAFAYLGPIVFDNTVGSIGIFEVVEHILFVLVVIFGIILWREK